MSLININLLGIGGVKIKFDNLNVYIDAFNNFNKPPILNNNDIVIFTHSDEDHFSAIKTLNAVKSTNKIIGPPSIAYPLLENRKLDSKQLKIVYPSHLKLPCQFEIGEISIKVYQTKHFIDWEPDHISFLLSYKGQKIYFTGDSYCFDFDDNDIYNSDVLIYSLVIRDVLDKKISSKDGAKYHINDLLNIQKKLNPRYILCNHLINCDWTVCCEDLQDEIIDKKIYNIFVPSSDSYDFSI